MDLKSYLFAKRNDILKIAEKHGASHVRFFGSVSRGEEHPKSDVDFLVDRGEQTSPWFPAGLVLDLENFLGRPVEVVTEAGLHPFLKESILKSAIEL